MKKKEQKKFTTKTILNSKNQKKKLKKYVFGFVNDELG